ncbi:hypothetical protein ACE1SV_56660 [Streptomyces sennicomposti]
MDGAVPEFWNVERIPEATLSLHGYDFEDTPCGPGSSCSR